MPVLKNGFFLPVVSWIIKHTNVAQRLVQWLLNQACTGLCFSSACHHGSRPALLHRGDLPQGRQLRVSAVPVTAAPAAVPLHTTDGEILQNLPRRVGDETDRVGGEEAINEDQQSTWMHQAIILCWRQILYGEWPESFPPSLQLCSMSFKKSVKYNWRHMLCEIKTDWPNKMLVIYRKSLAAQGSSFHNDL